MQDLLKLGAAALKKAALNVEAKNYILNNPAVYHNMRKAADRYIGGETLIETLQKVQIFQDEGYKTSIEFMGESTLTEGEALDATEEFLKIVETIRQRRLNATVSLDLSHIGLAVSKELCLHHLDLICREAATNNTEVIISAEGYERTDAVLDCYTTIQKHHTNVGITLQAYLYRSKDDFKDLIQLPGRIRMVKGAFDTPGELALPRGAELDWNYLTFVDELLSTGHACSIATHDPLIQQECKKMIGLHKAAKENYEFESLFGIQNHLLQALKEDGFPTKLYFVYGREWYLYLCNRIAEHPLNVFQAIHDIVS